MDKYVSVQTAIKTTWMILEGLGYLERENRHLEKTVDDVFDTAPAADVVEVVRCRECKYTKRDGADDPAIYCKQWDRWEMPPEAYCWLGKRKEEATT